MNIFVTGGTGFIGQHVIAALLAKGHSVQALIRPGSEKKLPSGCPFIYGDPLQKDSFARHVPPADTFVHLVGVTHPSPVKAYEFRTIDLASAQACIKVARESGIRHFVYLSVATPAPIMKAYLEARLEGEALIRASGMNATFVKPWYVLGPGRRWPLFIAPIYWVLERIPKSRPAAVRLGFVTIDQIVRAMVSSIETPPQGIRILDVPAIRKS